MELSCDPEEAALRLDSVSLSFRGVRAVNDVSLAVARGEVVGLIGPNGAGKTSVFNLVSGIYRSDDGRIEVFGNRTERMSARSIAALGVARTFQNLNLFPTMTVAENVMLGRHLHRAGGVVRSALGLNERSDRTHRDHVHSVLALCGLASHADSPVVALSYGVQKRVELARAVAMDPRLLLLDEPASGMNGLEKSVLAATIASVAATLACSVLVVEHDIAFVRQLAARLIVLDHGTVLADGAPDEVLERSDVRIAYLGEVMAS